MDRKGQKFAHLLPSPHIGWVGSGTIISVSYDEALRVIDEMGKENETLKVNPEEAE